MSANGSKSADTCRQTALNQQTGTSRCEGWLTSSPPQWLQQWKDKRPLQWVLLTSQGKTRGLYNEYSEPVSTFHCKIPGDVNCFNSIVSASFQVWRFTNVHSSISALGLTHGQRDEILGDVAINCACYWTSRSQAWVSITLVRLCSNHLSTVSIGIAVQHPVNDQTAQSADTSGRGLTRHRHCSPNGCGVGGQGQLCGGHCDPGLSLTCTQKHVWPIAPHGYHNTTIMS